MGSLVCRSGERLDGHDGRVGMGGVAGQGFGELLEGHGVERADDGVTDALPEQLDVAATGPRAGLGVVGVVAGADHGGDGPLERGDDLAHAGSAPGGRHSS